MFVYEYLSNTCSVFFVQFAMVFLILSESHQKISISGLLNIIFHQGTIFLHVTDSSNAVQGFLFKFITQYVYCFCEFFRALALFLWLVYSLSCRKVQLHFWRGMLFICVNLCKNCNISRIEQVDAYWTLCTYFPIFTTSAAQQGQLQ